jgi:hypothetical protein
MADALSKAQFSKFRDIARETQFGTLPVDPAWMPRSILAWLLSPAPDDDLGERILKEIALRTPVLGYNC